MGGSMYIHERPDGPTSHIVSEAELTMSVRHVLAQPKFRAVSISRETIRILVDEINQRWRDTPGIPYVEILRAVFKEKLALIGNSDIEREAYKSAVAYIQANRGHSSKPKKSGPRHDELPPAVRQAIEDDVWQDIRNNSRPSSIFKSKRASYDV
ncbi:MAG: hypothetical protein ABIT47_01605 [Candidatus Paceibacterota bacterium]